MHGATAVVLYMLIIDSLDVPVGVYCLGCAFFKRSEVATLPVGMPLCSDCVGACLLIRYFDQLSRSGSFSPLELNASSRIL